MRDQLIAAIRGLRHRGGVAATVVLTLRLGIGANSPIFLTVDAVLLKPLPCPAADRLVAVYELNLGQKHATQLIAPGRIEEWYRATGSFEGLAGSDFENMTETTGSLPERVEAMQTSPRFFSGIGVRMALGARTDQILGSVVAQAATVTGAGIVAGLGGAFVLTRFMTTLVFGIRRSIR